MVRTQVQLTEEQVRELRRLAASRGVSMAAIIRDVLDEALTAPRNARLARAKAVVGRFSSDRTDVSREHDRELAQVFGE
jgi:hypothetical protein